jgi:hypothetical protein
VLTYGSKGVVRKQLRLSFLGDTFEGDRLVIADCQIRGLSEEVSGRYRIGALHSLKTTRYIELAFVGRHVLDNVSEKLLK